MASPDSQLNHTDRQALLALAQQTIQQAARTHTSPRVETEQYSDALQKKGAAFVTLKHQGKLRGCIGSLTAHRPLVQDVASNAFAAAFNDPRFAPVTPDEADNLQIHLSILSEPIRMKFDNESDLLAQLQPGVDGLILCEKDHKGTFLPSVWEMLPDKKIFLERLKQKAGLSYTYWSDTLQVYRYTTQNIES